MYEYAPPKLEDTTVLRPEGKQLKQGLVLIGGSYIYKEKTQG